MKKILIVTGCNGYIGSHVINYLSHKDDLKIIAVGIEDKINTAYDNVDYVQLDIFNIEDVLRTLPVKASCLHMAWRDGFNHFANSHISDLPKHLDFINALVKLEYKNISIMGSMHDIGYHVGEITDITPHRPVNFYGIAKNTLYNYLKCVAKQNDISYKWLRAFYILGDDKNNNSIFTKILKAHENKQVNFPFTTGQSLFDFIQIDELARQISESALQTQIQQQINCCSGKPISLRNKIEEFILEHKLNINLEYGAFPDRHGASPAMWGNNAKIKQILNNIE